MKIFKFGGASVKDAASIHNVYEILKQDQDKKVVVISAMGKTTNALEKVVDLYLAQEDYESALSELLESHKKYTTELFENESHTVFSKLDMLINNLSTFLKTNENENYAFVYDQIVSLGELLSTTMVAEYLNYKDLSSDWIDVRPIIHTTSQHRAARIQWEKTEASVKNAFEERNLSITQGFIGSTNDGSTTTLGREGSDFTAAILAHALDAESVTTWKDVPGILNADPRLFPEADLIPQLSYAEAVEMTYYGAKVIHPKTIQPLFQKSIPLYVRSFKNPEQEGSTIQSQKTIILPPIIVVDKDQVWLKIKVNDLSFIAEHDISDVLKIFSEFDVKINLLQTAALTLNTAITYQAQKLHLLLERLRKIYDVEVEENLVLMTIRHYTEDAIAKYIKMHCVIIEQKTETTLQCLMKNDGFSFEKF